jgi:hypothetical protein
MNDLQKYIEESWSDEVKTMNDLQNRGIVSDNAVIAKDVSSEDAKKAVEFLNEHSPKSI